MTSKEIQTHIVQNIIPQLREFGVEAFCFAAVLIDTDGKQDKMMVADGGNDSVLQDSLRPVVTISCAWAKGELS